MEVTQRSYDTCYGCEFLPQITGHGDVFPCGNHFERPELLIGNICTESFKNLVFGKKYADVTRKVREEINVHSECGIGCHENEINEYLFDLVATRPAHVNFI